MRALLLGASRRLCVVIVCHIFSLAAEHATQKSEKHSETALFCVQWGKESISAGILIATGSGTVFRMLLFPYTGPDPILALVAPSLHNDASLAPDPMHAEIFKSFKNKQRIMTGNAVINVAMPKGMTSAQRPTYDIRISRRHTLSPRGPF